MQDVISIYIDFKEEFWIQTQEFQTSLHVRLIDVRTIFLNCIFTPPSMLINNLLCEMHLL